MLFKELKADKKIDFIFLVERTRVDLAIEHINIGGTILVFKRSYDISKAFNK